MSKKKNNRIICFVLVVIIGISFTACNSNSANDQQAESEMIHDQVESELIHDNAEIQNDEIAVSLSGEEEDNNEKLGQNDIEYSTSNYEFLTESPNCDAIIIPEYMGDAYVTINDNNPFFDEGYLSSESYDYYSELDNLGRCGVVCANIGIDIMPTEERGSIGMIKPSGWQLSKYDFVDGHYLYNRCHLIGYQLTGINADTRNLITGTRYLNIEGMLPFENMVANYVSSTSNHVLYRVTPIFEGENLLAAGVLIEAESCEDKGTGIKFCVFCYNIQPGVLIDYADGSNSVDEQYWDYVDSTDIQSETENKETPISTTGEAIYILNTNTHRFHYPYCDSVNQMKEKNKQEYCGDRETLIEQGYIPCGECHP